jgi:hypothetical protein
MEKAHHNNERDFEELTYAQQSSSINAQINNIKKQILANAKKAAEEGKENPVPLRIERFRKLIQELEAEL